MKYNIVSILIIPLSIAFIIFGYFAVFKTKLLLDYYKKVNNSHLNILERSERSLLIQYKISGIIFILMALAFLFGAFISIVKFN